MSDPNRRAILRLSTLFVGVTPFAGCGSGGGEEALALGAPAPAPAPPVAGPSPAPGPAPAPPPAAPAPAPAPAPVLSTGERQFKLLSQTTETAPFCVGFALRKGDIPAGSGIAISGATAQATVKNFWPDGSAKFAVIAGTASVAAGVPTTVALAAGTASSGTEMNLADLQAAMTQPVTVGCGGFGSASWSGNDWTTPFQAWISGHRMSSWVYRKPVGSDGHLVAWLEVRLFAGGIVEILPWIENGYLLVAGPTSKSAIYTFAMGGTQRFSAAIDLPHHCRTPLVSGSITSHWLGTGYDVIVKHDAEYLQTTGLVPAYMAKTGASAASVAGLPSSFTPLQRGNWPSGMGSGGYHASIGIIPEWDVVHLTCNAASTYKGVIFNGYSAGRYPFHYRDENDSHRPPRLSLHPSLNIRPPEAGWTTTPATSGTAPPSWSVSHQPSAGYFAYLITGRRYFLDEIQMAASTNPMFLSSTTREAGLGLFKSQFAGNERHHAWCMRTVGQAVVATPDVDTVMLAEYRANISNNIDYFHARYIGSSNDPTNPRVDNGGFVQPSVDTNDGGALLNGTVASATTTVVIMNAGGFKQHAPSADGQFVGWSLTIGAESRPVTGFEVATNTFTVSPSFTSAPAAGASAIANDGVYFVTLWQQDFITASWGYLKDLALQLGATPLSRLDRLFTWKAESVVARLGSTGPNDYLYRDYAPYYLAIAPTDRPDWDGGAGPWFTNWGQAHAATYAGKTNDGTSLAPYLSNGPKVDGALRNYLSPEFPTANALAAIAYCVKHGVAGADEGYRRLTTASNWNTFLTALDAQPVWAVAPAVTRR